MNKMQAGLRGKIEHELDEMMMGAENYFGTSNPKRNGHIACAADRIMAHLPRPDCANADKWHLFLSENKDALPYVAVQIAEAIEALEKKVYIPGQWRCPKCEFRLTQSNLYAATGTVGPRDEPGDKCPNCNSPLWRVSAMEDRNEAYKCANNTFDRLEKLSTAAQSLINGLDTGLVTIDTVADETLTNTMRDLRDALRKPPISGTFG